MPAWKKRRDRHKMKKIKIVLLVIGILAILGTANICYAATSDSVYIESISQGLISEYGSNYEPPFIQSDDEIEPLDGSVSRSVVDLSLTGKNGFDLNILRTYNSTSPVQVRVERYNITGEDTRIILPVYPMYKYIYKLNGSTKTCWVSFFSEDEMVDEFNSTSAKLSNTPSEDADGIQYFKYSRLRASDGTITLTRDKNADSDFVYLKTYQEYQNSASTYRNIRIAADWQIEMPYIEMLDFGSQYVNGREVSRRYYGLFHSDSGELFNIRYRVNRDDDNNWCYDEDSASIVSDNGMSIEMGYDSIYDEKLGLEYDCKITDISGKSYYFKANNTEFKNRLNGKFNLIATSDKYKNVILYNYDVNNRQYEITDTFGRTVNVTNKGISVSVGGKLHNVVDYSTEEVRSSRDPDGHLSFLTKTNLIVSKHIDDNNTETTKYLMQPKDIRIAEHPYFSMEQYVLEKEEYPTGAYKLYQYEGSPSAPKYVINAKSTPNKGNYQLYRVTQESTFENGVETHTRSYSYKLSTVENIYTVKNTTTISETLPDGTAKSTIYKYDVADRLMEVTEKVGDETYKKEYKYYNPDAAYKVSDNNTILDLRSADLEGIIKFHNSDVIGAEAFGYEGGKRLTYYLNGLRKINNTYYKGTDIIQESRYYKSKNNLVKTNNTLTSDGRSIAKTEIYEGLYLKERITYTYNEDGTIESKTVTPTSGTESKTNYFYTYNDDGSYSVTEVTTVENADGVEDTVANTVSYNSLGQIESTTDGNGNVTEYTYDLLGRQTGIINPDGTSKSISYNISENTVTVTDENGNVTTYDYLPLGNMDKIYLDGDPSKVAAEYGYDNMNRKISERAYVTVGKDYVEQTYEYDGFDRITSSSANDNGKPLDTVSYLYGYGSHFTNYSITSTTKTISLDGYNQMIIVAVGAGASYSDAVSDIELEFDGTYEKNSPLLAPGECAVQVYDVSNISQMTMKSNRKANIYIGLFNDADDGGNIAGEIQTVTATYTGDSTYVKPTEKTQLDCDGNVLYKTYYKKGTFTVLNKERYEYDYVGNNIESASGEVYMKNLADYSGRAEYNFLNQPTRQYRADGKLTTSEYDGAGNLINETDYEGNKITHTYDALGREIRMSVPIEYGYRGETLTYYDKNGNIIKIKQQSNRTYKPTAYRETEYEYDSRNRLVAVKQNDGTRDVYTQYKYDNVGNVLRVVTGQTSKIDMNSDYVPDEAAETIYEYDRFGNVTKTTDAEGNVETAEYDLRGLPIHKKYKNEDESDIYYNAYGSKTEEYVWMRDGQLYLFNGYNVNNMPTGFAVIEDVASNYDSVNYTYDDMGNIASEKYFRSGVEKTYVYDVDGNLKSFMCTNGQSDTIASDVYVYDMLGRVTGSIIDIFGERMDVQYTYTDNGQVASETRDNGIETTYEYNNAGQLDTIKNNYNGNSEYTRYSYNYDGNISEKYKYKNGVITAVFYDFDGMGRLTDEYSLKDKWANTYTYDTRGNRIKQDIKGAVTEYSYDKNNRLLSEESEDIRRSYAYDEMGNLTARVTEKLGIVNNGDFGFGISIVGEDNEYVETFEYDSINRLVKAQGNGYTAEYTYGPDGLRESKTLNGDVTKYIYNGGSIVAETDADGNLKNRYKRDGHGNIIASKIGDTDLQYYLYDGQGVSGMLDDTSNTLATYTYDAFGNQVRDGGAFNPFGYRGEYTDEETGFIYLRNRYYDPEIGRFITEDPAKDGLNWYAYCGNDPVNAVDPWGEDAILLTSWNDAWRQGHTSALYQDADGNWFYTYWGNNAAAVITIPSDIMGSLDDFRTGLKQILDDNGLTDISWDYTYATYVAGDFTTSLDAAYADVNTAYNDGKQNGTLPLNDRSKVYQGKNEAYSTTSNNCLHRTIASFKQGTLEGGQNVAGFLSANNYNRGIRPRNQKDKFVEIFMNNSFTKEGAKPSVLYYAQSYYTEGLATSKTKALYSYAFLGWK